MEKTKLENSVQHALGHTMSGKYLTFALGNEEYGIEILNVREIMGVIEITGIPQVPEFVKGVINLRGSVIPVIDLRLKFNMPPREYDKETCIIVVNLHDTFIGVIVDTVKEVVDLLASDIDEPPRFSTSVDTSFILGIAKAKDRVMILLNLDSVLSNEEMQKLAETGDPLPLDELKPELEEQKNV